ncbi:MAG: hypothetical protein M3348_17125 [Acidobacteriota bacterium]|nr:hypothetical protein [Acidobacteriota bacterium]
MTVAQFLLPGESVLYEAPDEVYYRRTPFALYVTGERLLLYAVTGRLSPSERAVAEPLAGVESVEYSEGGLLSTKGRLDIRFPGHTLKLTGSPDTIKELWRALQQHALSRGGSTIDEEATLVAPPPPLFDDQPYPPTQVEPLGGAAALPLRRGRSPLRRPAFVVGLLFCLASAVVVAGIFALRASRRSAPQTSQTTEAAAPATLPSSTPAPTPLTIHVMDEVFTLEDGAHRAVKFTVPPGVGSARVSGGFRVTGGSYVDFYLMRQEQYDRFATGEEPNISSVVYREAQWNAKVGERLTPGDYYLVFDNRDTEAGAQTVAAEFFLVFDQQPPG